MANTKTKEKGAPKKAAPKKVTPLSQFAGFPVRRSGAQVIFGCGAVKVAKKDLSLAAEYVESPDFKQAVKLFTKLANAAGSNMSLERILQITPAQFRGLVG